MIFCVLCRICRLGTHFDEKREHVVTQMRIRVVQIFNDAFGPLKAFFAERASAVQRHYRRQVLQLHAFVRAQLKRIIERRFISVSGHYKR